MKILMVSKADHTGAAFALSKAIREHTPHDARAICYLKTWLEYPYDIFQPSPAQLRRLVEWADVLNLHDEAFQFILPLRMPKKPVVTTYHGSWYRNSYRRVNQRDRQMGFVPTCLTADLSMYGPRWIGRPFGDHSRSYNPDQDTFRVIQSASQPQRKNTSGIRSVLAGLPGVTFEVITRVPWLECLRRKSRGRLSIDKVGMAGTGFGTSSLEAWAFGMPVICGAKPGVSDKIKRLVGYLPYYEVNDVDVLRRVVVQFRDSAELCAEWAAIGRQYLREHHDPKRVAEQFTAICEGLL